MNITALESEMPVATRRRRNGKRSFTITPASIIAWSGGYTPITETEALLALGWIFRRLSVWKSKANVFDMMRVGSGCGSSGFPSLSFEGDAIFEHLRELLARVASHPQSEFARFARRSLGYRSLATPLRIPVRKPAGGAFEWLHNLYGCRLKTSPNTYHKKAVWLHGAYLRLNAAGTRWHLGVRYSYRHEDGWAIGLEQRPGEAIEDFDARAWIWLRDQIAWRHDEQFYHRFFVSADGMKRNELKSCADTEKKMYAMREHLRKVFAWGVRAPGLWEQKIAESLVRDAHPQFRELKLIDMTGPRLATVARWIRQDRRAQELKTAAEAAA